MPGAQEIVPVVLGDRFPIALNERRWCHLAAVFSTFHMEDIGRRVSGHEKGSD